MTPISSLNRLQLVDFPDDPDISYAYDQGPFAMGRLTGVTDQSGSTGFGYDERGRLVEKSSTVNGIDYLLSRSYSPGGRVNTITYPTGRTIDFVRADCACRVDAIYSDYNGERVTLMENLTYRPFGGATGLDTGSGGSVSNVSDTAGHLRIANPGQPTERTFDYYPDGNLKSVSVINEKGKNRTYQYDALNRLTKVDDPYGAFQYGYQYDPVGNRLAKMTRTKTEIYWYEAGTNKLYYQWVPYQDIRYFAYDPNGNMTGMGDRILVYNQGNRLMRVEENFEILGEYVYNALGQRVIKEAGGLTTVFHYDFDGNIICESDLSGTFIREYLYRGQNRLLMVDVASQAVYTYLNDRLGTPLAVTDAEGNAVWEATYRPFGEPRVHPLATLNNNFRFLGQYYDEETGLYYNWHRYYDPKTGRYLTPDPIGLAGGINLYTYALNNPIGAIDPLGLVDLSIHKPGSYEDKYFAWISEEGSYTFTGHGSPSSIADDRSGARQHLDAAKIADLIRSDPAYKGQPVKLFSCNTGAGTNSLAQQLADILMTPVIAPTDKIEITYIPLGVQVIPMGMKVINGGRFETFRPRELPYGI